MANPLFTLENAQKKTESEDERPQKRIKITASNGRRVIQEMKQNRPDKVDMSKSAPRRVGTKGTLARLLGLPLDVLFEVSLHI